MMKINDFGENLLDFSNRNLFIVGAARHSKNTAFDNGGGI